MRAVERYRLATGGLLAIAVLENNFRGALDEQNFFARRGAMNLCSDSNGMASIRGNIVCSLARSMPSLLANG
jgi:hypothetical protein